MRRDVACILIMFLMLLGFGYFYVREYYPLQTELLQYKKENMTLVSVVNELRKEKPAEDTIDIEKPAGNYIAQDIKDMIEGIEVEQVREEISITLPGKCNRNLLPYLLNLYSLNHILYILCNIIPCWFFYINSIFRWFFFPQLIHYRYECHVFFFILKQFGLQGIVFPDIEISKT